MFAHFVSFDHSQSTRIAKLAYCKKNTYHRLFDVSMTLLYICFLFGLIAGLLIGAAGIGGVILVPLLVYVAGIDIHTGIAASVAAFFVSGLVGTVVYSQRGIIQWPDFVSVCVGAIPGALLGAYVLPKIESYFLTLFIALVLILSAVRQFIHSDSSNPVSPTCNRPKFSWHLLVW